MLLSLRFRQIVLQMCSKCHHQAVLFRPYQGIDLGGNGGCLIRSAIAATCLLQGKDQETLRQGIEKAAATARADAVGLLRSSQAYSKTWKCDDSSTELTDGGLLPGTYPEWLRACVRPRYWPCERMAGALSTRIGRRFIISAYKGGARHSAVVMILSLPEAATWQSLLFAPHRSRGV